MRANLYVVNVEAAILSDGKWLLAKRSETEEHAPGVLSLIGGKVESDIFDNNILEKTLKREVLEEVGIEIHDAMSYVKSCLFIANDGQLVLDIVFLCYYKFGEAAVLQPDELSSVIWMTLEDVMADQKIPSWTKESLKLADALRLKAQNSGF
jgi:8-oxo-dGTP diphosphatase